MGHAAVDLAPGSVRQWWSRPRILAVLVVATSLAAQVAALPGEFFSDNAIYITDNPTLLATPLYKPWQFFTGWTNRWEYLPVRDLSYRLDAALFGLSPVGFRLSNFVLYALACAACFLAARAVVRVLRGPRGDVYEDVLVAATVALFAVHPAHVESVAWIASRKDLLSGLFGFAALWQFGEALVPERTSWRKVSLAALLYALALLSKGSVIPLGLVALLLASARLSASAPARQAAVRALGVAAPLLALSVASVWLSSHFATVRHDAAVFDPYLPPIDPAPLALRILGTFAQVAIAPVHLRLHYDVRVPGLAGAAVLGLGVVVICAAGVGAWAAIRRRSVAGFGIAWFALFTAPFLQLVPFKAWSEMCERWLFMPSAGLALAAAALLAQAAARGATRAVAAGTGVVVAAGLVLTAHRSSEWASVDRLVRSNLARAPSHPGAVVLAMTQWERELRDDEARAAASRLDDGAFRERVLLFADGWQALREGRRDDARGVMAAMSAMPQVPLTAALEGGLAERTGDDFEALRYYAFADAEWLTRPVQEKHRPELERLRRELATRPDSVQLLAELGDLQAELRFDRDAGETYRRILQIAPDLGAAHYNLGMVLLRSHAYAEAAAEYRIAAQQQVPDAWNSLGLCQEQLGDLAESERSFRTALAADERSWKPAYNLALMLMQARRPADARAALLVARERAGASNAAVAAVDALLAQL